MQMEYCFLTLKNKKRRNQNESITYPMYRNHLLIIKLQIMDSLAQSPKTIEKEQVSKLTFPKNDVLDNTAEKLMRSSDIEQAMRLGNIERYKVKIIFEDKEDVKMVHTTIWAVTEKRIALKAGVMIPVHRIHSIKFF